MANHSLISDIKMYIPKVFQTQSICVNPSINVFLLFLLIFLKYADVYYLKINSHNLFGSITVAAILTFR